MDIKQVVFYETNDGMRFLDRDEAICHAKEIEPPKEYEVTLYFTGRAILQVKAHDEEDAIDKARDICTEDDVDLDVGFDFEEAEAELLEEKERRMKRVYSVNRTENSY